MLLLIPIAQSCLLCVVISAYFTPLTQLSFSITTFCNIRVVLQLVLVKLAIILQQILLGNGLGWIIQAKFTSAMLPQLFHSGIPVPISWKT
jgi:hypothetical protein